MEELKDLVYILNRYTVRNIDVITNPEKKKTKDELRYWEFYVGIDKDTWKTEDEAAQHFGYSSKGDKGFRRLKDNLKEKLLSAILFTDLSSSEFTDYQRKSQEAAKLSSIADHLHRRGATIIYFEVAEKALSLAIETESVFQIIQITSTIRLYYAVRPKLVKDFERVSKIFDKYWPLLQLELGAQRDYILLCSNLINKKGYKKEFVPLAVEMYKKYENHLDGNKTLLFNVYSRLIEIYARILNHEWHKGLLSCNIALKSLDPYKERASSYRVTFSTQKASCLLMLGKYDESLITLTSVIDLVSEGSLSWFKNREIAAVTNLYAENYQASWDLVQMALNHERFKIISEVDQETWRLYFGYLHFIGKVENKSYWENDDQPASRFRLARLMNEMPNYIQDKRGGNIPLLILQVLFLLSDLKDNKVNYDIICNRIDAIKKYSSRNLDDKSEHFRSDCFIHLLGLLPKHLYDPKTLIKTAHTTLHRMSTVQAEVVDNSFEVEVVPYERQWTWIMYYVEQAAST
jgi:hypothetical protein